MYKNHSLRFDFTNESSAFDKNGNNKISIRNVKSTVSLNFVTGGEVLRLIYLFTG